MNRYNFDDRDQFAEDILKMLESGSPNDVKIILSDGNIFANKDILMARSEYFRTMLSNNKFIEGETSTVDMSHCRKAVMEKIIKFLFIGAVTFTDLSLIQHLELFHMAKMMLLEKFQEQLEEYVINDVIIESGDDVEFLRELISALKIANQYNLEDIKFYIIERILFSFDDILSDAESSNSFKSLPFSLIREINQFVLPLTCLGGQPNLKLRFDSFIIWLSENEITEEQKDEIVESFEFEGFTVEELMTSIRDSGLYPANKIDQRVLVLFKEQSNLLEEKEKSLKEKDKLLKAKNSLLSNQDITLREKNQEILRIKAAFVKLSVERLNRFKV